MTFARAMIEYYRPSLIDLFIRVQAIQVNPIEAHEECYAIQQVLIQRILYVEGKFQESRTKVANLRKQLAVRQTKEQAQEIKNILNDLHQRIEEYRHILYIFRSIGDTLAFTYLSTWDIKPMSFKESPGFLSGKKGLREERRILRRLFDKGIIAILNDLTNNLRYGDITAIAGGNTFKLIEVKSGKQREMAHAKQLSKLQKVEEYLDNDVVDDLYEKGQQLTRINTHSEEKHHRDKLNQLIHQAGEDGFVYTEVERGLVYIVDTSRDIDKFRAGFQEISKKLTSCIFFMLNAEKYNNRGYYPFPLSIEDPIAAYDFYAGEITLVVLVDLQFIKSRLAPYNLSVDYSDKAGWSLKIIDTKNSSPINDLQIGNHFFGRLAFDFLSLDWFIDEILHKFDKLGQIG